MNQLIKFQTTDTNEGQYADLVDRQSDIIGEIMSLDEFNENFPNHNVFMEVVNNHCYRPGSIEQYAEVDGRVFYLDDVNEDQAIEIMIPKEELIKQYRNVLG